VKHLFEFCSRYLHSGFGMMARFKIRIDKFVRFVRFARLLCNSGIDLFISVDVCCFNVKLHNVIYLLLVLCLKVGSVFQLYVLAPLSLNMGFVALVLDDIILAFTFFMVILVLVRFYIIIFLNLIWILILL